MKHIIIIILLLRFNSIEIFSEDSFNYELELVPIEIQNLPGFHSYAFAQTESKWLIVGGRIDGLHPRQPFNAFNPLYSNKNIYVLDIENKTFWSKSVLDLPTDISEQLQSSNLNFHQTEDTLYLIGGYGFSEQSNTHKTFPFLTTVSVSGLMEAVINDAPTQDYFKQIEDENFAVTGGQLKKLNDEFYLVGGHRFDGRYNPMGNQTYTQIYTNQIRKFKIDNSENNIIVYDYNAITDPVHLRRRDYNLIPQIFPNGKEGFTISSGVFQINADLPYLYPVDITANDYTPITSFNQYLSNYHSAVVSLYDSLNKNMHSIFFGGISQYYYENGNLIKDDNVPFVNTISRLTRDSNNNLNEYLMPVELPGLKGASAEFIPNLNLPNYSSEIIKLSDINSDRFLVGHILGGINSSELNPFTGNRTSSTNASNSIYQVWLSPKSLSVNDNKIDGGNLFDFNIYPNPFKNNFNISFELNTVTRVSVIISNKLGQIIYNSNNKNFNAGENILNIELNDNYNKYLFVTVIFDDKFYVSKKILSEFNDEKNK